MADKTLDIFAFPDFRSYLREYYRDRKAKNSGFSYASFSKLLGFKSRSYIQDVIAGKKKISLLDGLESFQTIFKDQPREFEYFKALVRRDQSQGKHRRENELEVVRQRGERKAKDLTEEEYFFYTDWYFIPIYFLPLLEGFRDDAAWIRERMRFKLTLAQTENARAKLLEAGLWKESPSGRITLDGPRTSRKSLRRDLLYRFHGKMLELGRQSFESPTSDRFATGTTFHLTPDQLKEVHDQLMKFKELHLQKYASTESAEPGSEVYHFAAAVFPLSRAAK